VKINNLEMEKILATKPCLKDKWGKHGSKINAENKLDNLAIRFSMVGMAKLYARCRQTKEKKLQKFTKL
jgi:hypothetical protein